MCFIALTVEFVFARSVENQWILVNVQSNLTAEYDAQQIIAQAPLNIEILQDIEGTQPIVVVPTLLQQKANKTTFSSTSTPTTTSTTMSTIPSPTETTYPATVTSESTNKLTNAVVPTPTPTPTKTATNHPTLTPTNTAVPTPIQTPVRIDNPAPTQTQTPQPSNTPQTAPTRVDNVPPTSTQPQSIDRPMRPKRKSLRVKHIVDHTISRTAAACGLTSTARHKFVIS